MHKAHYNIINMELKESGDCTIHTIKLTQIREGFEFSYSNDSLYVPADLIEMIIDFTLDFNGCVEQ